MMIVNDLQENASYIKRVKIIGIFNRFNIILNDLQSGINILHGDNGSGKTTVMHIITNALNEDYERFLNIDFNQIEIIFNNDSSIEILRPEGKDLILKRSDSRREIIIRDRREENESAIQEEIEIEIERHRFSQSNPFPKATYFPAFRNIMEAWNLLGKTDEQDTLARQLFGEFVPSLHYLSPPQIEKQLLKEFRKAKQAVIDQNQEVLAKSFGDILLSFSTTKENSIEFEAKEIFKQIKQLSKAISNHPLQTNVNFVSGLEEKIDRAFSDSQEDSNLSGNFPLDVLKTYREALQKIVDFQDKIFSPISSFIELFNVSLARKRIEINRDVSLTNENFLKLTYLDGKSFGDIRYLSSGERQIFTLMYAITHVSQQNIVLIDEPEISIHIDAQSLLLDSLSEQATEKQIIACTHSQRIAGKRRDRLQKIQLLETDRRKWLDSLPTETRDSGEGYELSNDIESLDEE